MEPDISIVVPMYNCEYFLKRSLKSCAEQDYNGGIQIVLVNDGSTDDTFNIAKKIIKQNESSDRKFDLYSQVNKGTSAAKNFGVSAASSDNILFLDSDDYLEKEAVSACLDKFASGNNIGLVYSDHRKVSVKGEHILARIKNDFSLSELLTGMYIGAFRAMPKKMFEKLGGFDESLTHAEDYDLVLKIATEKYDILHVPEIMYNYVFNNQSLACGDGGFEKMVKSGQKVIEKAFKRLGLEEQISFGKVWKTKDTVTRYLTEKQVANYLNKTKDRDR